MDTLAWYASAAAFTLSMSATPGPNNTMVMASGAAWGWRRTLPHMVGVAVGFPAMLLAVAFGAGELLHSRPWLHDALRWIGAAYLLWLAWQIASARPAAPGQTQAGARPLGFARAALFQWVNPKAWIIAVGAVVTYTTQGSAVVGEVAVLALIFAVVSLPCLAAWTLAGVGASRLLRTPAMMRGFNLLLAGLLVLSLAPLLRGE